MSSAALLWADDLQAPLAWARGKAVTRHQYLNDVHTLAGAEHRRQIRVIFLSKHISEHTRGIDDTPSPDLELSTIFQIFCQHT